MYTHCKSTSNEPYYSAIGASGAVFGIMFSAIMLFPYEKFSFFFFPFIQFPAWALGIGYLLYSIYGMKNKVGNIGHSAHLGGAMGGFVITLLLRPSVFQNNQLMIIAMGVIIGGLLFFGDSLKLNK